MPGHPTARLMEPGARRARTPVTERDHVSCDTAGRGPYTIEEHRHRFASWAASTAASVKGCRFSVKQGKAMLEGAGLNLLLQDPANLPNPVEVDITHRAWRNKVIATAQKHRLNLTHGVAAKLINIYFNAGFVCAGYHTDARVRALHPPIDSVLLLELSEKNIGALRHVWNEARRIRWSRFNSDQYEKVILSIRVALQNNAAMWTVEKYWRGYQ